MLMGRIEHLMEVANAKTLFLSFSSAATEEIERRINSLFDKDDTGMIHVKTCHALGNMLLLRNYHRAGFRKRPVLVKDWELIDSYAEYCREMGEKLPDQTFLKTCLAAEAMSYASNKPITDEFVINFGGSFIKKTKRGGSWSNPVFPKTEFILETIETLREFRKENGYYLFQDMISMALELPENLFTDFNYEHILVDEVQDLNYAQHQFIQRMQKYASTLTLVGDTSQCIYGFQGSQPEIFQNIEEVYPETVSYKLEVNYRCSQPVLNLANQILQKELNSTLNLVTNEPKPGVGVQVYKDQLNDIVSWVTKITDSQDAEEKDYSNVAILFRSHRHTPMLEIALSKANIPYLLEGKSFFDDPVVEDILAYFHFFSEKPFSNKYLNAWQKIIRHKKYLGRKTEEAAVKAASVSAKDILSMYGDLKTIPIACRTESQKSLFKQLILDLRSAYNLYTNQQWENLAEFASQLCEECWIDRYASDSSQGKIAMDNKAGFVEWLKNIENGKNPLDVIREHQERVSRMKGTKSGEGVQIMTVHKSKGLEWDNVAIWNVGRSTFPLDHADPREERRLCYVAVTRARHNLGIFQNELEKPVEKPQASAFNNKEVAVQEQLNPIIKYAIEGVQKLLDALL